MKRIPNKTAVATICYGIGWAQSIKIVDHENEHDLLHRQNGKVGTYAGRKDGKK